MQHPGEVLQREMNECSMSRKELALRTGVTEKHIWTVTNGEKSISTGFARKLGYVLKNAEFWLKLQAEFDADQTRFMEENAITQEEIEILKPLHDIMQYLIERGHMHNDCGEARKVMQLRELLQISDLTQIPKITYNAAYRAQLQENIKVDPFVLFAWQRLCEIETKHIAVNRTVDKDKLRSSCESIKAMMFGDINDGIQKLQLLLADCGIAFQVVHNFRGAPVQGFIKETTDHKLILCLTIRGKRADTFWFTLFHEIAHILNGDYSNRFVDFDSVPGKQEELANRFAGEMLIPSGKYQMFIRSSDCTSWSSIVTFAEAVGVMPFIVLGRLQNDKYLEWTDYPGKVARYDWA